MLPLSVTTVLQAQVYWWCVQSCLLIFPDQKVLVLSCCSSLQKGLACCAALVAEWGQKASIVFLSNLAHKSRNSGLLAQYITSSSASFFILNMTFWIVTQMSTDTLFSMNYWDCYDLFECNKNQSHWIIKWGWMEAGKQSEMQDKLI